MKLTDTQRLTALGVLLWVTYGFISALASRFALDSPPADKPVLWFLSAILVAFVIYLAALFFAVRARGQATHVLLIVSVFAVAFRVLLLFSTPILEVDIYRYVWDGNVAASGVSPFHYSPHEVRQAQVGTELPADLEALARLRDSSPATDEILKRVHFGQLPTVYPPVSQVVFFLAAVTTPDQASVSTHLWVMKLWIVLFDLLTIAGIVRLLQLTKKPVGWVLAYAWAPLAMKEFANSGHLDSIAVCFTVWSVVFWLRARDEASVWKTSISAVLLALGVGAKLFPVVLAPLIAINLLLDRGWKAALQFSVPFLIATVCLLSPTVFPKKQESRVAKTVEPTDGFKTFLSTWEMNDFAFMIVIENLRPEPRVNPPSTRSPWFVVLPRSWRQAVCDRFARRLKVPGRQLPFLVTRLVTLAIFFILLGLFSFRSKAASSERLAELAFLSLAWFWLLAPTLNPWYWTWALPFVVFARNRVWLGMSGCVLIYYARFWFRGRPDFTFERYCGVDVFDYVVVWIEFAPLMLLLLAAGIYRALKKPTITDQSA